MVTRPKTLRQTPIATGEDPDKKDRRTEIREKAKIRPGDKLALLSLEKDGAVCCLSLIKAEELEKMVKSNLGPVINEAFQQSGGRL